MILKINTVKVVDEPKAYAVKDGNFSINGIEQEFPYDETISSVDVSDIEDYDSIERNTDGEMVIRCIFYVSKNTYEKGFFSIRKENGTIDDAGFPYQVVDGKTSWENNIEAFEGLTW